MLLHEDGRAQEYPAGGEPPTRAALVPNEEEPQGGRHGKHDEHVRNVEQRDKMQAWLTKAVLPARGVNTKADFILAGTVLHFDSVLARTLDVRRSPGWRSRRYRAVLDWSPRQDLWQEWERRYTDWHKPDEERMADAAAFFAAHRDAMLEGTAVLWPDGEPYYTLMRQRIDDGPTAFASEKQNEPLDPALCDFHTVKLKPHSDKKLRIQKLGPLIHSRRLRFTRKLTALYDQLRYFPHHAHDDGPDALELCLEVLGEIGWVMLDVAPPEAPAMTKPNSPAPSLREAANEQIKQQFARHFERDDYGTCGECLYLGAGGRCTLRELLVEPGDPGCDAFDLRACA